MTTNCIEDELIIELDESGPKFYRLTEGSKNEVMNWNLVKGRQLKTKNAMCCYQRAISEQGGGGKVGVMWIGYGLYQILLQNNFFLIISASTFAQLCNW